MKKFAYFPLSVPKIETRPKNRTYVSFKKLPISEGNDKSKLLSSLLNFVSFCIFVLGHLQTIKICYNFPHQMFVDDANVIVSATTSFRLVMS